MIDLRSDTVTRPDAAMLAAMAAAPVGDDVYGDDPTINELEREVAAAFGKEAGLFCATGTLSNLLGVWLNTPRGGEVLCDQWAHIARAEMGAHGCLHGVTMRTWASDHGRLRASDVTELIATGCGPFLVETACVAVEDTHNFGGGTVQDFDELVALSAQVRAAGVRLHLDGARLANACAVNGRTFAEYGEIFDTISLCLSKGLGAPVGSVLVGTAEEMARARVQRKRLGAGWRQAGLLAAAAKHALHHNLARIGDDHVAAKAFAAAVNAEAAGTIDESRIESNIVIIPVPAAGAAATKLKEQGIALTMLGPTALRAVTHLDVTRDECVEAGAALGRLLRA